MHHNIANYFQCDSSSNWLEVYSTSLAFYLQGNYRKAHATIAYLEGDTIPPLDAGYVYLLKGRIERSVGNDEISILSLDSAMRVFQEYEYTPGVFFAYIDLVEHYRASESWREAKNYLAQMTLLKDDPSIPKEFLSRFYHRKAALWVELRATDSIPAILRDLRISAELAQEANAPWQEATAYINLGFNTPRRSSESMDYFMKSLAMFEDLGYTREVVGVQMNLAWTYSELEDYDKAFEILDEAYDRAVQYGWTIIKADVWLIRSNLLEGQGKLQEALDAHKEYHELRLAFVREVFQDKHAEIMAQLGTELARNELLKAANAQKKAEAAYESVRTRNKFYIISAAIAFGGLALFMIMFARTKRLNNTLTKQKNLTAAANASLENTLEQKDMLYRELHHRVKNNLANLSGLLYLQEKSVDSEIAKSALASSRNRIQAMSAIHKGLYQVDEITQIDLQNYLEELLPSLISMYDSDSTSIEWKIECKGLLVEMDKAAPLAMIINEILTNSLKYAFADLSEGILEIEGELEENGNWKIHVRDNGPGLPPDFNWKDSKSLGLKLIHVLSADLNVTVDYTYQNQLSTFTLTYLQEENGSIA